MKKIIQFSLILLLSYVSGFAQINAVTDTGDEVVLYKNGTWKYVKDLNKKKESIPINNFLFKKSAKSKFLLKSKNLNVGVYLNAKEWKFSKGESIGDEEYLISKRSGDIYGMIITEKLQIPLLTLKEVVLENARNAAPDIQIVKQEYRLVNGKRMLMLQMEGTIKGMKLTYFGYYYSNFNGTVQFIAYTGQNTFKKSEKEIETLLNGLVELKK